MNIQTIRGYLIGFALIAALLMAVGCGDHWDLPTSVQNRIEDFGANDTSFVRLTPDWDAGHGYTWTSPTDILVGRDGHIFVIDHTEVDGYTGGRVVEMTNNGSFVRDDLFAEIADTSSAPVGIGQDSKLNLFMVNGSDSVFVWNQYVALNGVESVMDSMLLRDPDTETEYMFYGDRPIWEQGAELGEVENLETVDIWWGEDPDLVASVQAPYVFYIDSSYAVGVTIRPEFTDVTGGIDRSGKVYLSDQRDDRIIQVSVLPDKLIFLESGEATYTYTGEFDNVVIGAGQGQGAVNNATSLVTQDRGGSTAILFAQTNGNFLVQRISGSGENWYYDISPAGGGVPELQVLEYFGQPSAIDVGEQDSRGLGLIYVADQMQDRVTAFFSSGFQFREVAVDEILFDLNAGESLDEVLAVSELTVDEVLNPELVDFVAAREWTVEMDSSEILLTYLTEAGVAYSELVDPAVPQSYVAGRDTTLTLSVGVDTSVTVSFPILDAPQGVATSEGVVYISDTGNNRLLRFVRTDANTYLPEDPNQ
jgi:hypothetical protein